MSTKEESRSQSQKAVYTQTQLRSFEHHFSALTYTFVNGNGIIGIAPIFDEFINKTPKSGDSVYDYDNKLNFSIDANAAISLKRSIESFMESPDHKSITLNLGADKTARSLTIYAPNKIKLSKKTYENYVMRLVTHKDGEEEKFYHLMNNTEVVFDDGNEESSIVIESDMELLIAFLDAVIENSLSVGYHAIRRANLMGGTATAATKSNRPSRRVISEGDDDDDDDSSEDDTPSPSRKAPASRKKADASLEAEFDD